MAKRTSPRRLRVRSGYRQRWSGGATEQNVGCLLTLPFLILKLIFKLLSALFRLSVWCVNHPKQIGIIIFVLVTLAQFAVITDPSAETVSTGQLVFAWGWIIATIVSVAIWIARKIKKRGKQVPDNNSTENGGTDSNPTS